MYARVDGTFEKRILFSNVPSILAWYKIGFPCTRSGFESHRGEDPFLHNGGTNIYGSLIFSARQQRGGTLENFENLKKMSPLFFSPKMQILKKIFCSSYKGGPTLVKFFENFFRKFFVDFLA